MADRALVLSADRWEMPDEKTGEIRSGFSVWFINDYRDDEPGKLGYKPTKINATDEIFANLKTANLPALFDLDFGSRPGAAGKATLTLTGVKHVNDVNVFGPSTVKAV